MGTVPENGMAFMPSGQNTVDMIPELPDIDFFGVPVEDFYDDYVNELETRNSQRLSLSGPLPSFSGFQMSTPLPSSNALSLDTMQPQVQQQMSMQQQNGQFLPNSLLTGQLGNSMQPQSQQQPQFAQQMPGFSANMLGMPSIPAPPNGMSGQQGLFQTGSPNQNQPESGGSDLSFEHDDQFAEHNTGSSNGRRANSKLHPRETKTKRNPKQQMQNKQAQQRYRERRKQKFVEMEHALDQLASQAKDMNALKTQHHMLQGKTTQLEQVLRQKELEIERLHQQLESKKSAGSSESSEDVCDNLALGEDTTEACASQAERKKKQSEAELQQYQHDWKQHVLRLKAYFESQGLQNANPLGEGVDPAVMQQVAKMVGQSTSTCSKAMRAEGIKVLELMSRDIGSMTHITCSVARGKWAHILECLQLIPSQREAVMGARKEHLNKLRAVCQERQDLNLAAMGLMLPRQPDCPDRKSEAKSTLEGKLDCMSLNGYGSSARDNVDLNSVLDKIKTNLRKEQRIVIEMNFAVMNRILSPLQCAIFFMEAFPAHCDCLALANILAFQLHREDSFDRTGSASHSNGNLQHGHQNSGSHNSGNIDMATSNGGSTAGNVASEMDKAVQNVSRSNSGSA